MKKIIIIIMVKIKIKGLKMKTILIQKIMRIIQLEIILKKDSLNQLTKLIVLIKIVKKEKMEKRKIKMRN